ncbi:MAG: pantoate--beta-alanine ligase [Deltaproteobacteria bacterium]
MAMKVIKDVREMRRWALEARGKKRPIVFVPTMGFLHDGHKALLRLGGAVAKTMAGQAGRGGGDGGLVLSIFVNKLQFGPKEDFNAYPRDIDRDFNIAKRAGVKVLFAPSSEDVYGKGHKTFVDVKGLSSKLCGASRPGHFSGVATIVLKLFNIVEPDVAIFGKKDYQQLLIIKKMVKDLDLGVAIREADTIREPDGLAMSSRNAYLTKVERKAASIVPASIAVAKEAFSAGERRGPEIVRKVKKIMEKEGRVMIEYVKICDPETLDDIGRIEKDALLAMAVRIGMARLIDNCMLTAANGRS